MRPTDALQAAMMHHLARFSVRYGEELRFAGNDLQRARGTMALPVREIERRTG